MVNCQSLSFDVAYYFIKAHKDDHKLFTDLTRQVQLNCMADWTAKRVLQAQSQDLTNLCKVFPLASVTTHMGT